MRVEEAIDRFEEDNEDKIQDIILLGKNGSVRRLRMEEQNENTYFG